MKRMLISNSESNVSFLSGKTAVINGASSAIGQAITEALLVNGAAVVGTHNKREKWIDPLISKFGNDTILSFQIDFFSERWQERVAEIIKRTKSRLGRIDILVNVAGLWLVKPFLFEKWDEVECIWRVNYWAPYTFIRETLPHIMQHGGHIINIASTSGIKGTGQMATYGATKAALINLTESISEEFAPHSVQANLISPGPTDTKSLEQYFDESMKQMLIRHIPLNSLCKPEDVANASLAILMNRYMTGTNIILHGGRL